MTVPEPFPSKLTDTIGDVLKVAVTIWFALSGTTQLPVPLQPPPDQPAKKEFAAATAVSVTLVPEVNVALHVG